jgi:hypothetical protein
MEERIVLDWRVDWRVDWKGENEGEREERLLLLPTVKQQRGSSAHSFPCKL